MGHVFIYLDCYIHLANRDARQGGVDWNITNEQHSLGFDYKHHIMGQPPKFQSVHSEGKFIQLCSWE